MHGNLALQNIYIYSNISGRIEVHDRSLVCYCYNIKNRFEASPPHEWPPLLCGHNFNSPWLAAYEGDHCLDGSLYVPIERADSIKTC